MSAVLLDERVVAVQPALVRTFGLTCAVVLQQIHWHSRTPAAEEFDGHKWVRLPYEQFANETGLTQRVVRGAVEKLEGANVVLSCQPEVWDRTKWYRIDHTNVQLAALRPSDGSGTSNGPIGRLTSDGSGTSSFTKKDKNGGASLSTKRASVSAETAALEQTAAAQAKIRAKWDERQPSSEPVADGLAWIEKIRAERAGVRK